jgi:UDP-2,4-diacetamido-2,4,6-trideoxy-beta-L-altropyranose hydrolase
MLKTPSNLIIRADASREIGTGHVIRCLALAQAWQDAGGESIFVLAMESPILEKHIRSEGIQVVHLISKAGSNDDAIETATLAHKINAAWVAVDGYQFGMDYQRAIKDEDLHLLFIDDNGHAGGYCANLVLNQNIHAHESLYISREPYTRLLLGSDFVLLRREFRKWRLWKRNIPKMARKILVTLGGGDPGNVTCKVIRALKHLEMEDIEATIVIGPENPHLENIEDELLKAPFSFRLLHSCRNMADLMVWADMAIAAAGSTSWELAFMGLPGVIMVLAENQEKAAQRLIEKEVFLGLGDGHNSGVQQMTQALTESMLNPRLRQSQSENGRLLVDGLGTQRVIEVLYGI